MPSAGPFTMRSGRLFRRPGGHAPEPGTAVVHPIPAKPGTAVGHPIPAKPGTAVVHPIPAKPGSAVVRGS
ncbi:hypothetical protein [Arthrobacter sulfonylureivorans]|uniref:Uncharacterized protein n=1 Tax=Arthrobacter sulfonylureivorans TaxID=2486855 RepID=A0ABY3WE58_9MICC|nr:hypothetical protein [Arthrobacter sulfonylureivorans]UNK47478.1 hypothetical protein MNQ99_09210 [Arthrobacter sulfonylureivorans]